MKTRTHTHEEVVPAPPDRVFALLHTPSAIREWWGASRAIVQPGPLPFEADFETEFTVEPHPEGAELRVSQAGFPCTPEGDEFYAACEKGWRETFAGIRRYLEESPRAG